MCSRAIVKLNLPEYSFRISKIKEQYKIWDSIRKKLIVLTPEEWVRQNIIEFLSIDKKFPKSLIQVEKKLIVHNVTKRCDIVLYSNFGKPILLVECKAPSVKISQDTFHQISIYNFKMKVPFILVTNGLNHFFCKLNFESNQWKFYKDIPLYSDLVESEN